MSTCVAAVVRLCLLLSIWILQDLYIVEGRTSTATLTFSKDITASRTGVTKSHSPSGNHRTGSKTSSDSRSLTPSLVRSASTSRSVDPPSLTWTDSASSLIRGTTRSVSPSGTLTSSDSQVISSASSSDSRSRSHGSHTRSASVSFHDTTSVKHLPTDSLTSSATSPPTMSRSMSATQTSSESHSADVSLSRLTLTSSFTLAKLDEQHVSETASATFSTSRSASSHKTATPSNDTSISRTPHSPSPSSSYSVAMSNSHSLSRSTETASWGSTTRSLSSELSRLPTPSFSAGGTQSRTDSPTNVVSRSHSTSYSLSTSACCGSSTITFEMSLTLPRKPSRTPSPSNLPTSTPSRSDSPGVSNSKSQATDTRSHLSSKTFVVSDTYSESVTQAPRSRSSTISRERSATATRSKSPSSSRTQSDSFSRSASESLIVSSSASRTDSSTHADTASMSETTSRGSKTDDPTMSSTWSSTTSESSGKSHTSSMATTRRGATLSEPTTTRSKSASWLSSQTASRSSTRSIPLSFTQRSVTVTATIQRKGAGSVSLSESTSRSDSTSPSSSSTESRGTVVPTVTRMRRTASGAITISESTTITALSESSELSKSMSLWIGSITNANKSYTRSRSRDTHSQDLLITMTHKRTLTLTATIPVPSTVGNALGGYFLSAFDFAAAARGGLCSALPMTFTACLLLMCVIVILVFLYRRYLKKERPNVDAARTVPPWRALCRENVYAGIVFPCHFGCWWIHILLLLLHWNGMCVLMVYILFAFEAAGRGGVLAGTSALGAAAGLVGAAIAHILRPVAELGFFYVTFDDVNRPRCQNEEGVSWVVWHRTAKAVEAERIMIEEEKKRIAEVEKREGLHLVQAAMMADVNECGWDLGKTDGDQYVDPDTLSVTMAGGDGGGDTVINNEQEKGNTAISSVPLSSVDFAVSAARDLTLEADVYVSENDHVHSWRPPIDPMREAEEERQQRLARKWQNPLSQDWWGPVETHHLIVGVLTFLVIVVLMSALQHALQSFSPSACNSGSAPLPVALIIGFLFDCCLFEPIHQLLRIIWRYAKEHEGTVDYSVALSRRLSRLIVIESEVHPYRGEVRLWPEEALQRDLS